MNITFLPLEFPAIEHLGVWGLPKTTGKILVQGFDGLKQNYFIPTLCVLVLAFYVARLSYASASTVIGPVVGYRNTLEPTIFLRLRFVFNAVAIMNSGYYKFKNAIYLVKRMDKDVIILPMKYLNELRMAGRDELSASNAIFHNLAGDYTNLHEMRINDHIHRSVTHFLSPNINGIMKEVHDEVDFSLSVDLPHFDGHEWKSIDIHSLLKRVISRVASRVLLGLPYCRDESMVSIAGTHTLCVFGVALILRMFPPVFHPLVVRMIPHRWSLWRNIRETEKMTQKVLHDHQAAENSRDSAPKPREPRTVLEWMINDAQPQQKSLYSLASCLLALTVASVWTSSHMTSHLLIFLAQNPQYIIELREEIISSTNASERIDPSRLYKLEACLSETLRLCPPQMNLPTRFVMRDLTLNDGVFIPKGSLVGFPGTPYTMDSTIFHDPSEFIPFRKTNLATPVTTPTKGRLAFGWGIQACPGRFFAAKQIKLVAARLLMDFDIELAPESDRMRRYYEVEDIRVLNPSIRLLMRRRAPKV